MKKASRKPVNDMRAEYDFASMKGGIRGSTVKRYRAGTKPRAARSRSGKAFPTDAAANEALRAVISLTKVVADQNRTPSRKPASFRVHSR